MPPLFGSALSSLHRLTPPFFHVTQLIWILLILPLLNLWMCCGTCYAILQACDVKRGISPDRNLMPWRCNDITGFLPAASFITAEVTKVCQLFLCHRNFLTAKNVFYYIVLHWMALALSKCQVWQNDAVLKCVEHAYFHL